VSATDVYVDDAVKDAAESVAAALEGAMIFYSPDEAGAVVMQYNATENGGTYVVDIDENGNTRSGTVELETGWDA
jgi:hypothetical protein